MPDTIGLLVRGTNYHSLEGLYEEARTILSACPHEHDWMEIGRSAEENPIYAACLGDGDFRKPELLYLSGVHPMEYIGPRMSLEVLRSAAAAAPDSRLGRILRLVNLWFIPTLNPDGYIRVQHGLTTPLGLTYVRTNANGVDLNRNFPTAFYKHTLSMSPFAGSILPFSPYYHGKEPCSEPESQVLRDFILGHNVKIALDLHSFGNVIMHPYGYTDKKCRDEETFRIIGREILQRQTPLKYKLLASHRHYAIGGSICDWLYDEFRILAFLMELGPLNADLNNLKTIINPFYWANPVNPEGIIENNRAAILYLTDVLYEMFA